MSSSKQSREGSADWFLPAIFSDGDVQECLQTVIRVEQQKITFVSMLQHHLCSYRGRSSDSISELSQRVRKLENTLNFRIGMLAPERKGAWFREALRQRTGPFPESIYAEPVFASYNIEDTDRLRHAVQRAWHERRCPPLPFTKAQPCLWSTVLELNQAYEQVCRLERPFQNCRLDQLPDGLPDDLATASLRAFLAKVSTKAQGVRQELDHCFEMLWRASCGFWDEQLRQERRKTQRQAHFQQTAEDIRDKFRERRNHVRRAMTTMDAQALKFFGLEEFPNKADLRRLYLDLARRYHPDCGGSEDQFKQLTRYHAHLQQRLDAASQAASRARQEQDLG